MRAWRPSSSRPFESHMTGDAAEWLTARAQDMLCARGTRDRSGTCAHHEDAGVHPPCDSTALGHLRTGPSCVPRPERSPRPQCHCEGTPSLVCLWDSSSRLRLLSVPRSLGSKMHGHRPVRVPMALACPQGPCVSPQPSPPWPSRVPTAPAGPSSLRLLVSGLLSAPFRDAGLLLTGWEHSCGQECRAIL